MKAPVYIFEGTWWSSREVPLVLPYFEALSGSDSRIVLSHRTIRNAEDIRYYVKRLGKGERAFLYFACHGRQLRLYPVDGKSPIHRNALLEALSEHREKAIGFVHFGCCEMVDSEKRRASLSELLDASGAQWASGYTRDIDWLRSTLFDLSLISEVFVEYRRTPRARPSLILGSAKRFLDDHDQLARSLGFSALSRGPGGRHSLFPPRLR